MQNFQLILNQLGLANVKAKPFELPKAQLGISDSGAYQNQVAILPNAIGLSYLGTAIIDQIQLFNADYSIVLDSVLLTVAMSKNIVTTAINGRNGTIKEYISDGDYSVSISGGVFSKGNEYPLNDVKILLELLKSPQAINVSSAFLQLFGIYQIAVESYSMPQSQGVTNAQPFEITGQSDEPIELLLNV